MIDIYYFESLNPRKVCATAKHLGIQARYVRLDLGRDEQKTPEHLARNPNGKVPVLVHGDLRLWESVAIMAWLATHAGSSMWPTNDPRRLTEVLRWVSWDALEFLPHVGTFYFEHHIKPKLGIGPPDEAAVAAQTPLFHASAKVLDTHLEGQRFVAGDSLSIADFCLASTLPMAEEIKLPLQDYSHIRRWHDRLMDLPAWRDPWPK